ncbi:hypothetical protein CDAR_621041 [Caerostris darwini]|uniref:Uncharacterized protein n=1 Tax=Caerostris darwini TaxID=1538125 RepID=A0AAV4T5A2_9ARAC|nr:hypothetical protein CDAR_621041 [Caerostris darwini]
MVCNSEDFRISFSFLLLLPERDPNYLNSYDGGTLSVRSALRGSVAEISRFYRKTWVFEFGEDATPRRRMNPFPDCVVSVLLQMLFGNDEEYDLNLVLKDLTNLICP